MSKYQINPAHTDNKPKYLLLNYQDVQIISIIERCTDAHDTDRGKY